MSTNTTQQLADRVEALEIRDRELDRLEGRLLATDAAVFAVSNFVLEAQKFHAEQRAANVELKKAVQRAIVMPLALVAFFAGDSLGAGPGATMAITLASAALLVFFPELAAKLARRTPIGQVILGEEKPAPAPAPAQAERATFTNETNGQANGKAH